MKTIWIMLLMISSICAFTACSDDDNGNSGDQPYSGLYLPDNLPQGDTVVILAKGFSSTAELYLQKNGEEKIKMNNAVFSSTGVTFVVPEDLALGTYLIVLKQDGNEWVLGTKEVVVPTVVKWRIKTVRMINTYLEANNLSTFTYNAENKLVGVTVQPVGGDSKNGTFTYSGNEVASGGAVFDNEELSVYPFTWVLEDGRIVNSKEKVTEPKFVDGELVVVVKDIACTWKYTEEGYLTNLVDQDDQSVNAYTYDKFNMTETTDGTGYTLEYAEDAKNAPAEIDVATCIYCNFCSAREGELYAYLMGYAGKFSAKLPTGITVFFTMTQFETPEHFSINYSYEEERVKQVTLQKEGEHELSLTFTYEEY